VDQETLESVDMVDETTVLALAVKIGGTVRLIDNCTVFKAPSADGGVQVA